MNSKGFALMKILPILLLLGAVVLTAVILGQRTGLFNRAAETIPQTGTTPTYKKCVNNACTSVVGVGIDSCQTDANCGASPSATPTVTNVPQITISPSTTNFTATIVKNYNAVGSLTMVPGIQIKNSSSTAASWNLAENTDATFTPPGGSPTPVIVQGFGFYDSSGGIQPLGTVNVRAYTNNNRAPGVYKGTYNLQQYAGSTTLTAAKISYEITVKEQLAASPQNVVATITKLSGTTFGFVPSPGFQLTNYGPAAAWQLKNNQDASFTPPNGSPNPIVVQGFGFLETSGEIQANTSQQIQVYASNNLPAGIYKGSYNLEQMVNTLPKVVGTIGYTITVKDPITPTPIPTPTKVFKLQVSSGANNVNQDGTIFTSSSPQSVWIGTGGNVSSSYAAFRFTNVQIPKNAVIKSATLQGYSPSQTWIGLNYKTYADKSANSAAFSKTSLPASRPATTAYVTHSSNIKWLANTWQNLADTKTIVQEIVNQPNWQSGNSLSIILKGGGKAYGRKSIRSYNGNPQRAAQLIIEIQ